MSHASEQVSEPRVPKLRRAWAFVLHVLFPSYGRCLSCGIPWRVVDGYCVWVTRTDARFCMCGYCWGRASLAKRYSIHYRGWKLYWQKLTWDDVHAAVDRGSSYPQEWARNFAPAKLPNEGNSASGETQNDLLKK